MLTQEYLKSKLHYDPIEGKFTTTNGKAVGRIDTRGYVIVHIDGMRYQAHRLAWLYVHGYFPTIHIDHANRIRNDNSIKNLRECSYAQNQHNTSAPISNTSGFKGVYYSKRDKKWQARCSVNRKRKSLGYYETPELAYAAYVKFALANHGQFFCG